MADYDYNSRNVFQNKDGLTTGAPLKAITATEHHFEYSSIATSISTKADLANPTFTGTVNMGNGAVSGTFTIGSSLDVSTTLDVVGLSTLPTVDIDGGNIDGTTIGGTTPAAGSFSTVDIDGGTIDDTVIGGTTPVAGTFTTFTSTGIDDNATSVAITIDAAENVGFGETNPQEDLHITDPSPIIRLEDSDNSVYTNIVGGNTPFITVDPLNTGADSTFRLFIDGDVAWNVNANNRFEFYGDGAESDQDIRIDPARGVNVSAIWMNTTDVEFQTGLLNATNAANFEIHCNGSSGDIVFVQDAADVIAVDPSGNLNLAGGNGDGLGVNFGSTTNDPLTTLDYYEENDFSSGVTVTDTQGVPNVATTTTTRCNATRVGNLVFINIELNNIDTTGLTATDVLQIRGLPFAGDSSIVQRLSVGYFNGYNLNGRTVLGLTVANGSDVASFITSGDSVGAANLTVARVTSGANAVTITGTYMVD